MNATTETTVFKSKWGYHPCSKETALKLRTINRQEIDVHHIHQIHWRLPEVLDRHVNRQPPARRP